MIEEPITLVGLGGIGSYVAESAIALMGTPALILYDPDVVEPHNRRNQLYGPHEVGMLKARAIERRLKKYQTIPRIIVRPRRAGRDFRDYCGIVIAAVDSLEARQDIFAGVRYHAAVPLFIEAGAGGSVGIIYAIDPRDPDHVARYERTLKAGARNSRAACVDPTAGAGFAWAVGALLRNFSIGWRPRTLKKIELNATDDPFARTLELQLD